MKRRSHEKFCEKDLDGRCAECRDRLTKQFTAFGTVFGEFIKKIDSIIEEVGSACGSCLPSEMDYSLSILYRNTFSRLMPHVATDVTRSIMKALGDQFNIKVFPLTEKAIRDDTESRQGKRR